MFDKRKRSFDEAAKTTSSEQCGGQPAVKEEERLRRNRKKENEGEDERGERGCSCKVSLMPES